MLRSWNEGYEGDQVNQSVTVKAGKVFPHLLIYLQSKLTMYIQKIAHGERVFMNVQPYTLTP